MNYPLTEKEKRAWQFSKEKHKDQVRKFTGLSYFDTHVQKVNGILKQYTTDEDMLISAICHDTIEDCYEDKLVGYAEIEEEFGARVADIVMELTSDEIEMAHGYHGNKGEYLTDKMINMSDDALTIKLCDRLQNISDAFTASEKFRNSYFRETTYIVKELESNRNLNKIQNQILNDIKSKLDNINQFKIKRFKDI